MAVKYCNVKKDEQKIKRFKRQTVCVCVCPRIHVNIRAAIALLVSDADDAQSEEFDKSFI